MRSLLLGIALFASMLATAQTGTEFWMAPPDVTFYHNQPGDQPIYLNVTTGNVAATVTVSQPANPGFNGGSPIVINLAANAAVRYDLTSLKAQLETRPTNSVRNTGLRIVSTADITCYYELSNTNNPDIMALKGANGLGTEFYIPLHKHAPFYNHNFSPNNADLAFASFDIVATENATTVMIYSPVAVDGHPALTPFTITLNAGQTYSCANTVPATHFDPMTHPSGAVVLSNKPVAVSIKDDSNHNPSGGCYDLMLDQIVPVNILGMEYVAVKGALNATGDESLFIMAVQNNTQVYINGSGTPTTTLFAGQYYRLDMDYLSVGPDNSVYVATSKPAYAIHVTGFGCEQGMAILPPLNCAGSRQLSFTRSTAESFFLNLLVRNGSQNDFVVTGPGTATIPGAAFQAVPGTGGAWLAARIQYNTTQVPVNQAFIVTNTSDVFSLAIINGGATSGCRYGFFSEFAGQILIDAGADQSKCKGSDVQLSGSVSGGSTTGIWTSSGSGNFIPSDTDLNATYVPSIGDLAMGSVTITLTSTGNCTPVSDALVVTFFDRPLPDAGTALQVCTNAPAVLLNGTVLHAVGGVWTGGAGSFLPSNNNLNAQYNPTPAEVSGGSVMLYLTTVGNGVCNAEVDSVLVTFTPSPTANAGPDQTRCANNPVAFLAGGFTVATGAVWSGGAGAFDPSTTNVSASYTPSAAEIASGSVILTLTTTGNGNCLAVSDQVVITFTDAPVADAGLDVSLCQNNATLALGGAVLGATGGQWSGGLGTFAPGSNALNATYTPTLAELAAGSLTLTLTTTGNGNCLAVSDSRTLTFTPAPVVDAGVDGSVCANNSAITLAGSVIGATGGVWSGGAGSYAPNNTTLNATYTPTAAEISAGTVTLTLTSVGNGTCNPVNDQVTFTITPAPTVNAGPDHVLCGNNASVNLNASITVATGVLWSGGTGMYAPGNTAQNITYSPSPLEIANGTVVLTVTTTGNGTCAAVNDHVTLSFTATPTANAGADVSVSANNPNVTLSGSFSVATGAQWSGGLGAFNPGNTAMNAVYTPTVTEIANGSMTLTLTTTGNGTCAAVNDQMTITFTAPPTVDAGPDQTVCANNASVSLNGSVTVATGGVWTGGAGTYVPNNTTLNATYTPTAAERAAGSVTLTLTSTGNGNSNPVSDQIVITITPSPTANAGADVQVCANSTAAVLNGSVGNATGGIWSGGMGTFNPSSTSLNATYTPTVAEITAGSVALTLTTTGIGNCLAVQDQMIVLIAPAPVVNAGPPLSSCANNPSVVLAGSVNNAAGGIWSGGTGVYSPGITALNATYTPSVTEIANGSVTLTLTSTGNGTCQLVSSNVTITFTPAPIVSAGPNGAVCANNAAITLSGSVTGAAGGVWSGGAGSYAPNNTTLNATYTPTAAERVAGSVTLTLTSTGNGTCNPVSSQVTYSITPAPTVNAGADLSRCGNNPDATLNAAITVATGVQWSGGSGVYSPGSAAQNITYTPSAAEVAAGTVVLTATTTGNGSCVAVSDQVVITYTAAPTANAGPDASVSANNANVNLAGSFAVATGAQWSGGAGSYSPGNTAMNAVYTPTVTEIANGSVTLTLTTTGNGSCSAVSDQMTIVFTPAPTVEAGPDQTVCANNATVSLSGAVTVATGGVWTGGAGTFNPSNTTLNATYTPTAAERAAGSVTLTLTSTGNGNSNPVSDQVIITITPAPVANAGLNIQSCANQPAVQLAGSVGNASGGIWSGGMGVFTPSSTNLNATYAPSPAEMVAGTVTLMLTTTGNGNCLAVQDQMQIMIAPAPVVNAGPDQSSCANNPALVLAGAVANATGGIWSGGSGVFSPSITAQNATYTPSVSEIASGSVTLSLTSTGNGTCAAVNDQVMLVFTPSPVVSAGAPITVCQNSPTAQLNGSVSIATGGVWSGGTGTFLPNANTLNATYTPSPAELALGTATLTLTSTGNGNCMPVQSQVTITINPAPVANAGADIFVCSNNAQVQLGGSVSGAGGGQWSGGAGTFTPSIAALNATYTPTPAEVAAGSLFLTLTTIGNGFCAAVTDQVLITFTPAPTANAGTDGVYCANNANIALAGSVTVANGGAWSGAQGTFSPGSNALNAVYSPSLGELNAGAVTLTLTTTGNNGCTAVSDQVTFTFTPAPTVSAGADAATCANNAFVDLAGAFTVATGAHWSGGSGTFTPNANALNAHYVPTAAEIAAGSVTLTLTTTGNGLCNAVNDDMVLTITPAPVVNAGSGLQSCANAPAVLLSGAVQNAGGGLWSGAGTFTPSAANLNASYLPSAAEIAAGQATIMLTSSGNGLCNSVSDQTTIIITPAPVSNAGADQMLCANNATAVLSGQVISSSGGQWSGGLGTFTPSNTALGASYTPTVGELATGQVNLVLATTGNGGCNAVTDTVRITYSPAPTVNAGADVQVCANNPVVGLNGSVTVASGALWSGGGGTFLPSNTALNATYTPTFSEVAAGSFHLRLTTIGMGNCLAVVDSMLVVVDPVPVVNAGPDLAICANNSIFQVNGFVGNAPGALWSGGAGSYFPSTSSLLMQYQPTAAEVASGSITLTLSSTGTTVCNAVQDQVVVVFTDAPVVNAGPDQVLCANAPNAQLMGNVTNASGGSWTGGNGTFAPSANVLSPVYTPTASELASGNVTLILTSTGNGNCIATRDTIQLQYTPSPTVNAGVDRTVCANAPALQLNGSFAIAAGVQWTGGSGVFNPGPTDPNATYTLSPAELVAGTVTLTLTTTGNGNCLAVQDQMVITVTQPPLVSAGPDITTCANALSVPMVGSVTGASTTGVWSTTGTGIFLPSPMALNASYVASSLDSLNGNVQLLLTSTSNGLCNAVSDEMTLNILPSALAHAGPDVQVCATAGTITLVGGITGNATQGTWTSTGSGTFLPAASSANATYVMSAVDTAATSITFTWSVNSCDNAMDQMVVTIVPRSTVNAGVDAVTCVSNLAVLINGSVTGASSTGVWSTLGTGTFTNASNMLANIYQASPQDSLAQGVDLVLTSTGTGACPVVADTMHISIFPFVTVNAGPDASFCANNVNLNLNGTVSGSTTQALWSTTGTGTFAPGPNVLNPAYLPSAVDTAMGSVTLLLSVASSCNAASDAMVLMLDPAPYVNAGPDQTYCNLISQFNLAGAISGPTTTGFWSTTGSGTIAGPTSLSTLYTASAADIAAGRIDLTLTSSNNGNCAAVTDQMTIWLTNGVVVNAGQDQSVCMLSSDAQLNGTITNGPPSGVWTTSGTGTFSPSPNVLNPRYLFSAADVANGAVVLTLTPTNTGNCVVVQDQMVLTFGNSSFAYAGDDLTVCANNPVVTLHGMYSGGATGLVWSTAGSGAFSNTTHADATYSLSPADILAGTVQLTLSTITNGTCLPANDQVIIQVTPSPNINAGPDQIVCTSGAIQVNAALANAPGVLWTTSGTGSFLDPTAALTLYYPSVSDSIAGSITLLVTTVGTAPCNAVSDSKVITFGGGLAANAGNDVERCSTSPAVALNGQVSGTATGVWSTTGTGTFVPSATVLDPVYVPGPADFIIGNIRLVLSTTNNLGCPAGVDTMMVAYAVPPTVNAGSDVLLCEGITPVQLAATAQHYSGLVWTTSGTGSFSPSNTVANPIYLPSVSDSISGGVTLVLNAGPNGVCVGASDDMVLAIGPTRVAHAGPDQYLCATGADVQLAGSVAGPVGGVWTTTGTGTFLPNAQSPVATYVPSSTDLVFPELKFILTTTGNQGCPAHADTLSLFQNQLPSASAGADVSTCTAAQPIALAGSYSGATGVLWTSSGTGTFLPDAQSPLVAYQPSALDSVLQQVQLVITTTGNGYCPAVSDTMLVSFVNPLMPLFSVSSACVGVPTTFTDQSISSSGSIIAWNWDLGNGATPAGQQVSTVYSSPGFYPVTLTVYAQNACVSTTTQTIQVLEAPVANFGYTGEQFVGEPITFTDSTADAVSWIYDFGDGQGGSLLQNPVYSYSEPGAYIVVLTAINAAGCADRDSALIIIDSREILPPKFPNAFSPNGDGVNDVFLVRGGPFETMDLKIYNGWGELIFQSDDPLFGWDGTYKGQTEVNGVYVYSVEATTFDGRAHSRTGSVTLIR
ncbi:MAG: gliding motility-associated C-terminal domain-containing protein [Flavobacteriales bacterium]|nr:gliding motility-associated C-terminal domain-containing protein [Flavobacteriales bacterium]